MIKNHDQEIIELKKLGFTTNPLNKILKNLEEVYEYSEQLEKQRETLNYPIDGCVVKINNNQLLEELGIIGKTYRGWSAIKFSPDQIASKILDITFQVGRTGKITPVAELESVNLQGTTVKRATIHNIKEVLDYDIYQNDTIIIRKAGDIIPEIINLLPNLRVKNAKKIIIPQLCPSCNSVLELSNTKIDLFCNNKDNCPAQIKFRLAYFCSRKIANIENLSEKTIEKLINNFNFRTIVDIYNFDYQKLKTIEGFKELSINKLIENVDSSRIIEDYKFLTGLSIDGVGVENSKLINNLIKKSIK